ncbi:MAG: DUF4837 family protein [Balneolaceae bacterium]
MRSFLLWVPIAIILLLSACNADYRPISIGPIDEVIVVMDSTDWDSETALAIEETFGKLIGTLPTAEPTYKLIFRDFSTNEELDNLREHKNIIFASTLDDDNNVASLIRAILSDEIEERVRQGESFAFPLQDRWVRDQWTLLLTSTSDLELSEKILNSESSLVGNLMDLEFQRRTAELFRRGEQVAISDSLWKKYGWSVRMQHDYTQSVDVDDVVVFKRYLPDNNRWMLAWWEDDVDNIDFLDSEWINAHRDSLLHQYLRGEREESYITTEYRRPVITDEMVRSDHIMGFETLGTWMMTNDFMGGPFVNFTYYDPQTERLFMIEYGQFAPSVTKRTFVRQFRAMGRTFQADSTWGELDQAIITDLQN